MLRCTGICLRVLPLALDLPNHAVDLPVDPVERHDRLLALAQCSNLFRGVVRAVIIAPSVNGLVYLLALGKQVIGVTLAQLGQRPIVLLCWSGLAMRGRRAASWARGVTCFKGHVLIGLCSPMGALGAQLEVLRRSEEHTSE